MRETMEYTIVMSPTIEELIEEVNSMLVTKLGKYERWEIWGEMIPDHDFYLQAMVIVYEED